MSLIKILTIIFFFSETIDSHLFLLAGIVSRDRIYYATVLTCKHSSLEKKKKEETWAHKTQIHAAVSLVGVDAAVAVIAGATAASSSYGKDEQMAKTVVADPRSVNAGCWSDWS